MASARFVAFAASVVAVTALSGCSRAVPVDEPELSGAAAEVCSGIIADLPDEVMDAQRRTTRPGLASAAWGSPPVTMRCGVPQPEALEQDSQCFEVNGVGWFAEPGEGGQVFTTIGRDVYVEVGVPAEYSPEAGALTFFSDPINEHDPVHTPCV